MTRTERSVRHAPQAHRNRSPLFARLLVTAVAAATVLLAGATYAQASLYYVDTSTKSAMALDKNDRYCSLAEAIASVNAGSKQYDCVDQDVTSSTQTISLRAAAGLPFAQYHYAITSFTITATSGQVRIDGSGAFIDSTGQSAFINRSSSSLFMQRVTLTNTGGAAGGRLIENYGTLSLYGVTLTKGDVTTHPNGVGGAIYNEGTITSLGNSLLTANKAKRGGAIYNKDGRITNVNATISFNSATMAGGGIYNMATVQDAHPRGHISGGATTITRNTAKAGGGVFNRGEFDFVSTSITFNTATGTVGGTATGETCAQNKSCDGNGGGALVLNTATVAAEFRLSQAVSLSDNTATGLGGGIYNSGLMVVENITINRNKAFTGAAIYFAVIAVTQYCSVRVTDPNGPDATGPSSINGNTTVPAGKYSIVDGVGGQICGFSDPFRTTGTGNGSPTCAPGLFNPGNCPQP